MPFKVLKILFPKSILAKLHATKMMPHNHILTKDVCTVNLRHKDKCAKCRFFVIPGDGPALLGMPDIELLNILRVSCEVISEAHESWMFDLKTREASNSSHCRTKQNPTE